MCICIYSTQYLIIRMRYLFLEADQVNELGKHGYV